MKAAMWSIEMMTMRMQTSMRMDILVKANATATA